MAKTTHAGRAAVLMERTVVALVGSERDVEQAIVTGPLPAVYGGTVLVLLAAWWWWPRKSDAAQDRQPMGE